MFYVNCLHLGKNQVSLLSLKYTVDGPGLFLFLGFFFPSVFHHAYSPDALYITVHFIICSVFCDQHLFKIQDHEIIHSYSFVTTR